MRASVNPAASILSFSSSERARTGRTAIVPILGGAGELPRLQNHIPAIPVIKTNAATAILGIVKKGLDAPFNASVSLSSTCLLYTSDAADERSSVDLGGRRIIK